MSVSILIPAFRPTFLRQAIASVLTQGLDDFELVISDDSGGSEVLAVVERFQDPRIRYHATPGRIGAAANCRVLWGLATHDLMAYLFDDDLYMPHALVTLTEQIAARPDASFCFGGRYVIDAQGRIVTDPELPSNPVTMIDGVLMARSLVGRLINPIGELSNVLMNRAVGLTADDLLVYMGLDVLVDSDVALYLNATRRGPAIALSRPVAAFRKHGAQNSSPAFNPNFAMGICEWELFIRGEYAAGLLPRADARAAVEKLKGAYAHWSRTLPEISGMAPGLQALGERIDAGEKDLLDAAFRQKWEEFVRAVQSRPRNA